MRFRAAPERDGAGRTRRERPLAEPIRLGGFQGDGRLPSWATLGGLESAAVQPTLTGANDYNALNCEFTAGPTQLAPANAQVGSFGTKVVGPIPASPTAASLSKCYLEERCAPKSSRAHPALTVMARARRALLMSPWNLPITSK